MTAQSNTITLSSALNKYWRKIQGKLSLGFAAGKRPERALYNQFPTFDAPFSAYEVTRPLDLQERGGIASIPEGGFMAAPSSVNAIEATMTCVQFNGRISISDIAHYADRGLGNQLAVQLKNQATQKIQAMTEHFSDYFHGSATALLCTTNSAISGTTGNVLTLATGYGNTLITNAKYLASLFKVGERIVLATAGDALINGVSSFATITGVSKTAGTITVTMDGSTTYSTAGIRIYKANSLEGATVVGGSDQGKGLNGVQDLFESTTVHGVSSATYANWAPYIDTAAGRFTFTKLQRGKDETLNNGGLVADTLMISQGVKRDMVAQERAGLRYEDSMNLNFDGDVQAKGIRQFSTKNCAPGYARLFPKSAIERWEILPTDDNMAWGDLMPFQDQSGRTGRIDWFGNIVVNNRAALCSWSSQTEA